MKAQDWLNQNISVDERSNVRKLVIVPASELDNWEGYQDARIGLVNNLTGILDLSGFHNLERLVITHQLINRLILTNSNLLNSLVASDNLLQEVVWPTSAINLEDIFLENNNFTPQDLSQFSVFPRLNTLYLGTDAETIRSRAGRYYNRWNGSLEHLKDLDNLTELDLNATDVDRGLEYLPISNDGFFYFTFGNRGRVNAGVDRLKGAMFDYARLQENQTMEEWASSVEFDDNYEKTTDIGNFQLDRTRDALQALVQQND